MREGRARFERKHAAAVESPGKAEAAAVPGWLLAAVIIASSAALLGTSDESPPPSTSDDSPPGQTTYQFERLGIMGGSLDLTRDAPGGTFYINLRADALGPMRVPSTSNASMLVKLTVTSAGFTSSASVPSVNAQLTARDQPFGSSFQVRDAAERSVNLTFSGNCAEPTQGTACTAQAALELSRSDDGALGGVLRVDWKLDLKASEVQLANVSSTIGPIDPPWTVEVTR